jgi:uncharacterized protein (DUF3820 family)
MQIMFGKFKGTSMERLPEDYLMWLSKPKYSGKFYEGTHSTELKWKVPFTVKIEARKILESRGFTLKGEHWE